MNITGNNTYTGTTTVSHGTLSLGNGGTSGSIAGDITNNASLRFNRSDNVTYADVISGTGTVTKQGAGTLTLYRREHLQRHDHVTSPYVVNWQRRHHRQHRQHRTWNRK